LATTCAFDNATEENHDAVMSVYSIFRKAGGRLSHFVAHRMFKVLFADKRDFGGLCDSLLNEALSLHLPIAPLWISTVLRGVSCTAAALLLASAASAAAAFPASASAAAAAAAASSLLLRWYCCCCCCCFCCCCCCWCSVSSSSRLITSSRVEHVLLSVRPAEFAALIGHVPTPRLSIPRAHPWTPTSTNRNNDDDHHQRRYQHQQHHQHQHHHRQLQHPHQHHSRAWPGGTPSEQPIWSSSLTATTA
jgi:hypothetical protein